MKKTTITKKSTITTLAATLALSACDPGDEIEHHDDDDRQEMTLQGQLVLMTQWLAGEAASFVAAEAFGVALPTDPATLSDESLQEIRNIVADENRVASITEQNGAFNAVATRFDSYYRTPCETLAQTEPVDCTSVELTNKADEVRDLQAGVLEHYNIYYAWATKKDGLSDLLSDEDWRVYLSPNVRLAIVMDLTLRRELYEIEHLKGLQSAAATWSDLGKNAGTYLQVLNGIKSKYDEISSKFGTVRKHLEGTRGSGFYVACYDEPGPEGSKWCSNELGEENQIEYHCTDSLAGSYCNLTDEEVDAKMEPLLAAAEEHRTARIATFTSLALGDEASFNAMLEHLNTIVANTETIECAPGTRAFEAGPLASDVVAQEQCPGVCEAAQGTFTGQWWTTVENEQSVCQCTITC